jgi:phosphoesterase RecJ-like protein
MIFVEQPDCKVKVSWRARPGYDISKVAMSFGGGGHPAASGAEILGTLEEVQVNVLDATYTFLH